MSELKTIDAFGMFGGSSREEGLLPKDVQEELRKFPIGSQQEKGMDAEVIVRFYDPTTDGVWLITEGNELYASEWNLYCYSNLAGWEWYSVRLSQLERIKGIRRDQSIGSHSKVRDLVR